MVHRVGCALAFGGQPWIWSTDQPMDACVTIAHAAGWTPCQICEPFAMTYDSDDSTTRTPPRILIVRTYGAAPAAGVRRSVPT